MKIISFSKFINEDSKEDIDKMADGIRKNFEDADKKEKPKERIDKNGVPVIDKSKMGPKEQIVALSKHVYQASYNSVFGKYELKQKIKDMKEEGKLSEDEIAAFTEAQTEMIASELLRADTIIIQMVNIAADSPKLVYLAQELGAEAKAKGSEDGHNAINDLADKIVKKAKEKKEETDEETDKEDEPDKEEKTEK